MLIGKKTGKYGLDGLGKDISIISGYPINGVTDIEANNIVSQGWGVFDNKSGSDRIKDKPESDHVETIVDDRLKELLKLTKEYKGSIAEKKSILRDWCAINLSQDESCNIDFNKKPKSIVNQIEVALSDW